MYNQGGPAEYAQNQQGRQDEQFRQILQMMMMGMQQKTQQGQYADQQTQQKFANEMAQENLGLQKDKYRSDLGYQATRIPYMEAMTKEATARAKKLLEPTARKSYAPKTAYEISKHFGIPLEEFNALDPTKQDDYFSQYFSSKRSNVSNAREDSRRDEATLYARKNDLKELSKYYDNRSVTVSDGFKDKMLKDPYYVSASREPGKKKQLEKQYDDLARVEMYKVNESKKEAIYNLATMYPDYYRLAENKETGETIVALPDGSFFSVGTFKK